MTEPIAFEPNAPDLDLAVQRAALDLERIVAHLVQHYLGAHGRHSATDVRSVSWRALLEMEEQAFSDLGFQGRHDHAVIDALTRLRDSRLPGANIDAAADWCHDDDDLPIVYLIVRAMLATQTAEAA